MPAFHEVQFSPEISYGSTGGPRRKTQIVTLKSGFEQRNSSWLHSRRSYDAGMGVRNIDDLAAVIDFWEARMGQLYGFRWKDWADYKSCLPRANPTNADQIIGTGTGALTTFQLVKRYTSGGQEYARPIRKPVAGTLLVSLNNVAQPSGWSINVTTGILTFTVAPGNGVVVKAGYEFDVPVRFDEEEIQISIDGFNAGAVPSIKVVEIRT
jgi:uncharacterized protein (TIGR02217 family)